MMKAYDGPLYGLPLSLPYNEIKVVEIGWHYAGPWPDEDSEQHASYVEYAVYKQAGDEGYACMEWNGPAIVRGLEERGLEVPQRLRDRVEATQWRK